MTESRNFTHLPLPTSPSFTGCGTWEKMEFENIHRSAMPVLQETGEFNRQTEEILATIIFIENQLRERLTGEISVLCSGYIVTRCFAAVFSNSVRELEALETGLPISLLPKVEEIRGIASSIGEKVEELNDTIKKIKTKAREIFKKKLTKGRNHVGRTRHQKLPSEDICSYIESGATGRLY